jgi:hypothetical protein
VTIQTTVADSAYPLTDLAADLQEIADRNGDHWIAHNARRAALVLETIACHLDDWTWATGR